MANDKKSFLLYCDLLYTIEKMPDEKAGQLLKHILKYVNDLNPITEDLIIQLTFEPIRQQLKRDLNHWESVKKARSDNGKKGGRPKKLNEAKKANGLLEKLTKAKKAVNDNVNVSVIDKENKNIYIPEFSEFKQYAIEHQFNTNIQKLQFKYESWKEAGWIDGNGKKISNWKSKLLNTLPYLIDENIKQTGQRPKLAV